jgi:hypothetical protein
MTTDAQDDFDKHCMEEWQKSQDLPTYMKNERQLNLSIHRMLLRSHLSQLPPTEYRCLVIHQNGKWACQRQIGHEGRHEYRDEEFDTQWPAAS